MTTKMRQSQEPGREPGAVSQNRSPFNARMGAGTNHAHIHMCKLQGGHSPRWGVGNPEATLLPPLVSRGWYRWARRWRRRLGKRAPVPQLPRTARTCMCGPKSYMRRRCRQSINKPVCVLLRSTVLLQADTQCSSVQRLCGCVPTRNKSLQSIRRLQPTQQCCSQPGWQPDRTDR